MSSPAPYLLPIAIIAAVGSGLVAGLLFAFSTAVMKALSLLPPAQGMRAMQHVNVVILNPVFLTVFMGTALVSAVLAVAAALAWSRAGSAWLLLGALAYLIGTFGVTMAVNVPLNNRLAATDAASPDASRIWARYLTRWLRWNHLRTMLGTVAAAAHAIGASAL